MEIYNSLKSIESWEPQLVGEFHGIKVYVDENVPEDQIWFFSDKKYILKDIEVSADG